MRQYELTYLVSDKVSDADMTAATGKISGIITKRNGKILAEDNWGRRKLAYPINKQDFATYITLSFEMDPGELVKVNRDLRLSKEVIRHLVIVKDFGKEKITLTADEVAETEDIEEVVGGERSFEAVEGETEESYDLMAKRDDETEAAEEQKNQETKEPKKEEVKVDEAEIVEQPEEVAEEESETVTAEEETENPEVAKESIEEEATPAEAKPKAEEKPKRKAIKKEAKSKDEEVKENKKAKEKSTAEAEADRLAKLDEEIEGILGDDL